MKITKLTTFIVPPRWCFLKIETDQGITGWGEPVVEGRAHTVAAAVEELSDYLIGKDPRNIEDIWTVLYRGGFYRGGAVHMSALAGIDQALWDIKGKHLGVSVSDLLGGQVRDKIRVYSWIGGDRPADTARAAKEAVERGFTAVKMNGTEELQFLDTFDKVDLALANVAAVRDAVGPNVGIGVDFHGRVHKPMAKVLMKELDPYKLMFIEEPVLSKNYEALKELAPLTSTPIALGERLFSRWDFKRAKATSTSSSRMRPMPAASPKPARSPTWPKPTTWRWRCIVRSARLPWRRACNWTRSATTPSFRNKAWAFTTTRAMTCWTTSRIQRCSITTKAW